MFMGPRNWFQGMNFASLCSLAGRDDSPIPPLFLAPIDFLKIPAPEHIALLRAYILSTLLVLYVVFLIATVRNFSLRFAKFQQQLSTPPFFATSPFYDSLITLLASPSCFWVFLLSSLPGLRTLPSCYTPFRHLLTPSHPLSRPACHTPFCAFCTCLPYPFLYLLVIPPSVPFCTYLPFCTFLHLLAIPPFYTCLSYPLSTSACHTPFYTCLPYPLSTPACHTSFLHCFPYSLLYLSVPACHTPFLYLLAILL